MNQVECQIVCKNTNHYKSYKQFHEGASDVRDLKNFHKNSSNFSRPTARIFSVCIFEYFHPFSTRSSSYANFYVNSHLANYSTTLLKVNKLYIRCDVSTARLVNFYGRNIHICTNLHTNVNIYINRARERRNCVVDSRFETGLHA